MVYFQRTGCGLAVARRKCCHLCARSVHTVQPCAHQFIVLLEAARIQPVFKRMLGDFSVSVIHPTVTWTTGSSSCGCCCRCSRHESRRAAFELLTELCNNSPRNLQLVCRQLLAMHHQANPDCANQWEVRMGRCNNGNHGSDTAAGYAPPGQPGLRQPVGGKNGSL